jgi:carboxymethylenebutenolidase
MRIQFDAKTGKGEGELFGAEGKRPGVVLIQEWWGLNDHIRDVARRLANEGFVVLAVDVYHGKTTKDAGEASKLMGALDWPKAIAEIDGAVQHLRARTNGKVAALGFCMGGALTLAAACNVEGLAAAVPFYGLPDPKFADYDKVSAPILAHVAKKDAWVKPEAMEAIKKRIEARGGSFEMYVYPEDHAFFNDTRPEVYGKESAKLAWERTLGFLRKHLA